MLNKVDVLMIINI